MDVRPESSVPGFASGHVPVFTVQELRIQLGSEQEFVDRFREVDVLRLAGEVSDLVEAVLVQRDGRFDVISVWASESGIEGWLASEARQRVREALEPFYAAAPVVHRYEVLARYSAVRSSG